MECYSHLVTAGLITLTLLVSSVVSQSNHDCDKYCFASCSDYFQGPEFSPCVSANVHCSCISKVTLRNPLMIFLLIAGIMITLFCCGVCYGMSRIRSNRRLRSNNPRIIAQPVVAASPVPTINNSCVIGNGYTTSTNFQLHQPYTPGIASPMAPSTNLNNVPAEYLEPPPAYNTCVVDMNSPKQME